MINEDLLSYFYSGYIFNHPNIYKPPLIPYIYKRINSKKVVITPSSQ